MEDFPSKRLIRVVGPPAVDSAVNSLNSILLMGQVVRRVTLSSLKATLPHLCNLE